MAKRQQKQLQQSVSNSCHAQIELGTFTHIGTIILVGQKEVIYSDTHLLVLQVNHF